MGRMKTMKKRVSRQIRHDLEKCKSALEVIATHVKTKDLQIENGEIANYASFELLLPLPKQGETNIANQLESELKEKFGANAGSRGEVNLIGMNTTGEETTYHLEIIPYQGIEPIEATEELLRGLTSFLKNYEQKHRQHKH